MLRLIHYSEELQRHRRSAKLAKHFTAKGEAFEGNEALSCSFSQENRRMLLKTATERKTGSGSWRQSLKGLSFHVIVQRFIIRAFVHCALSRAPWQHGAWGTHQWAWWQWHQHPGAVIVFHLAFREVSELDKCTVLSFCLFLLCHRSL